MPNKGPFILFRHIIQLITVANLIVACGNNSKNLIGEGDLDDTAYLHRSKITAIDLNITKTDRFKKLGILWGFLKYYHPKVRQSKSNWDVALFKIIPQIDKARSDKEVDLILEELVNSLGKVPSCNDCFRTEENPLNKQTVSSLFGSAGFSKSLTDKLNRIKNNYVTLGTDRYISLPTNIGNPSFTNELPYLQSVDAGIRLLALFRYWNMIQYYYPYRDMIQDWEKVLEEFIPIFVKANTQKDYLTSCLQLVSRINDTHATVFGNPAIDTLKGIYVCPFQVKYVAHKLIVTNYYQRQRGRVNLKIGDIITCIDSVEPKKFIESYSNMVSASNDPTRIKVLFSAAGFALRSNRIKATIEIIRNRQKMIVRLDRIPIDQYYGKLDWNEPSEYGTRSINDSIGYIYSGNLKDTDLPLLKDRFRNKKALIIDLRCYPSVFMPFSYGSWLNCKTTPFALIKQMLRSQPATLSRGTLISVFDNEINQQKFSGKLIILVNTSTLSQGEYTAMALRNHRNALILGEQTAGADGDISEIILPGGISTFISGTRVSYPDGTETQHAGVKIDIPLKPSVYGIQHHKDEQLEAAISVLIHNNHVNRNE